MALVEVCPRPSQAVDKSTTTHIFLTESEEIEASRAEQTNKPGPARGRVGLIFVIIITFSSGLVGKVEGTVRRLVMS